MGNWRTVEMHGACPADQVESLRKYITLPPRVEDWNSDFQEGPLSFMGISLCGLGDWPAEAINAYGNLFERDYAVEDVAAHLMRIVDNAAPGLTLTVHCGGDNESKECIATIEVADGEVEICAPKRERLADFDQDRTLGRFLRASRR